MIEQVIDKVLIFFTALLIISLALPAFAEDYTFDLSEIEKKPYNFGGYLELKPYLFMPDGDYIKSFDGQLKTVSFTPILMPVYENINDSFGETNRFNLAERLYLLLYDTDIDFNILKEAMAGLTL